VSCFKVDARTDRNDMRGPHVTTVRTWIVRHEPVP